MLAINDCHDSLSDTGSIHSKPFARWRAGATIPAPVFKPGCSKNGGHYREYASAALLHVGRLAYSLFIRHRVKLASGLQQ
jgi:hypothetical protein